MGKVIVPRTRFYDWKDFGKKKYDAAQNRQQWVESHRAVKAARRGLMKRAFQGEGPFYLDFSEATEREIEYIAWSIRNEGRGTQFMRYFEDEEGLDLRRNSQEYTGWVDRELSGTAAKGLWVDKDLETGIRNLFAAGDEVGGLPWAASAGAFAMGWHAGEMAAKRAGEQKGLRPASEEAVKARRDLCSQILNRDRGPHWKEVELYVQNIMDFYCGDMRSEGLLKRGLERLDFAKRASMGAANPHELSRALEVMSIIENAELVIRASMERTESRPPLEFYRAEYPDRDDKNWLLFLSIRREGGNYTFSKIPIQ
jgi:succinate dehydrogenase/fumarate reductase flavoprotein subunit